MFNKGRRPWKRGAKKRYSVYKAEDRIDGEKDYEKWAKNMAEAKNYDLYSFYVKDADPSHLWEETYDRMVNFWHQNEGKDPIGRSRQSYRD